MKSKINSLSEYFKEYEKSINDPEKFWEGIANEFIWRKKWDKVLEYEFNTPKTSWFKNAKLNITENIFERQLDNISNKTAIIWEPNNPEEDVIKISYKELYKKTCQFSNAMESNGVKKGDRVIIYMPMVPEAAIAMLSCARIGAIHSIVFAGFSSNALADRINDCNAKMVLTSDGNFRGAKNIPVKSVVDDALDNCKSVSKVIVLKRTGEKINMINGRDLWWHEVIENQSSEHEAAILDSEDMLFILYTSGSTGKPKGVVHTNAGYMVYTYYSFLNVFQYNKEDIYWCTADIGWITGHSYIVYGPLLSGATTLMFEGVPTFPDAGRFWEIVDKHKVNIFYTAPHRS